jgi:hypothetical protein
MIQTEKCSTLFTSLHIQCARLTAHVRQVTYTRDLWGLISCLPRGPPIWRLRTLHRYTVSTFAVPLLIQVRLYGLNLKHCETETMAEQKLNSGNSSDSLSIFLDEPFHSIFLRYNRDWQWNSSTKSKIVEISKIHIERYFQYLTIELGIGWNFFDVARIIDNISNYNFH